MFGLENSMEIKQIKSFIAVAHALSFSRAARKLHLSQPALSAQIKALESHLGAQVLERNRRTVRLTPAGVALLADAETLVQQISEIELRVARVAAGNAGHLRIGFVASATPAIVPAMVLAFRKQYPGVELELRNLPTVQQVDALRSGNLDAGFIRMPLREEGLSIALVHREPFVAVLPKNHPLGLQRTFRIEQLEGEPFVAYGRRWAPLFYELWTGMCRRAGFTPNVIQETGEMSTALSLVAAGLGVAILPKGITSGHRRFVTVKLLDQMSVSSETGIATLASRRTPLIQHLVRTAREATKDAVR
jgi:LysR family transcriptional regulator, benzoate and cis,cis-muconate-responsive activator of ben and cat genes